MHPGFTQGVYLPYVVLAENVSDPSKLDAVAEGIAGSPGIVAASAPTAWRAGSNALIEAFGADDANSRPARKSMSTLKSTTLPSLAPEGAGLELSLGGVGPESRAFVRAVYGNFPLVLLFVLILTFILLMRAFRSILLPLQAVVLNLIALGAAYGNVVFIFQEGHGSATNGGIESTYP